MESTTFVRPTIIARRDAAKEYVMYVARENALVVFRSGEEVEKFRDHSGLHPESEGFEAASWLTRSRSRAPVFATD
jgi:hypothetical protein